MNRPLRLAGVLCTGVLLLSSCGQGDESEGSGSCPASVTRDEVTFNADSRFGTPLQEGEPLDGVTTVACPGQGKPVDAVAIVGIPTDVAFYAPDAYGPEFILVRDGKSLTPRQLRQLTG